MNADRFCHIENWREEALGLGWAVQDLDALTKLIALSRQEERVYRVKRYKIMIVSVTRVTIVTDLVLPFGWSWSRHDRSEPQFAEDTSGQPWCSAHGFACSPTAAGCGAVEVMQIVTCGCVGRRHDAGCTVAQASEVDQARRAIAQDVAAFEAEPSPEPAPLAVVPKIKPSAKNGWQLPGQQGLRIP